MLDVFGRKVNLPKRYEPSPLAGVIVSRFQENGVEVTTPIEERARRVAHIAHAGQVRISDGQPYHVHTDFVAAGEGFGPIEKAVGHLHDVPEKTSLGFLDLRWLGMSEFVIEPVSFLTTKNRYEPYFDGIERINQLRASRVVKMRDIEHNSSDRELVTEQLKADGNYRALEIRELKWDFQYPLALAYFRVTENRDMPRSTRVADFMQTEGCPDALKRWDLMSKHNLTSHPMPWL